MFATTSSSASFGAGMLVGIVTIVVGLVALRFRRQLAQFYARFGSSSEDTRRQVGVVSSWLGPILLTAWGLALVIGEVVRHS